MKLVVSEFMSLDGVVQAPGGAEEDTDGGFRHGGWSMPWFDPDVMGSAIDATMAETDALLFGRRTWEAMASAWPERAGDPYADRLNAATKYVVSSTLGADAGADADMSQIWANSHLIPVDGFLDAVAELVAQPGGTLSVWGSPQLTTSLVEAGLVDEYLLMIEPVLLGGGKRIFPNDGELRALELVSVEPTSGGVLVCRYRHGEMPPMPTWD